MSASETGLRDQILKTAMQLFIQQGYRGLAMRQISEALNISKAALYYYFQNKEELFLAILNSYLEEMETAIDALETQTKSSTEQIRRFVKMVLEQPAEQRAIIRLASQEMTQLSAASREQFGHMYHEKFIGKLKALLQRGMQRGEFYTLNAETATWALLGIMYPYFYPVHSGNRPIATETIEELIHIYLHGLSKPPGA